MPGRLCLEPHARSHLDLSKICLPLWKNLAALTLYFTAILPGACQGPYIVPGRLQADSYSCLPGACLGLYLIACSCARSHSFLPGTIAVCLEPAWDYSPLPLCLEPQHSARNHSSLPGSCLGLQPTTTVPAWWGHSHNALLIILSLLLNCS